METAEEKTAREIAEFKANAAAMGLNIPDAVFALPSMSVPPRSGGETDTASRTDSVDNALTALLGATGGTFSREPFERVPGDIPIEKFNYGSDEED